jgi:hypothetical protein
MKDEMKFSLNFDLGGGGEAVCAGAETEDYRACMCRSSEPLQSMLLYILFLPPSPQVPPCVQSFFLMHS